MSKKVNELSPENRHLLGQWAVEVKLSTIARELRKENNCPNDELLPYLKSYLLANQLDEYLDILDTDIDDFCAWFIGILVTTATLKINTAQK